MHPRHYGDEPPPKIRRKPGRKVGADGPAVQVSLRVPSGLLAAVDRMAALRPHGTRAEILVAALRSWLGE